MTERRPPRGRTVLRYVLLTVFALIYLGPFLIEISTSFKTDPDSTAHALSLIPHPATVATWKRILGFSSDTSVPILTWFKNSVLLSTTITVGRVFLDSLAGYALARLEFPGRRIVFGLVLATLAVPNVVLLIPRFLILKQLGLFNTYPGMILPIAADAGGIFIMRQFFLQVPVALEEAARIDGASIWRTYWSVVLPIVRPGLITIAILSFQSSWNEFAFFEIAAVSPNYLTLTTGLANLVGGGLSAGNQFPLKLGAALFTTIPVAVLFFVFQKRIVRVQMQGAVKE